MAEEEVNSDTETSGNSGSDDAETPQNEANEYEKQRLSRIAQNKSRMEAFGLHKIANSLMDLSQKSGKRKSQPKSKRVAIKSKEDDEYEPNDDEEEQKDDSSDSNLDSSSEEFEGKKKKKKKKANVKTSGSKKVNKRKLRSDKQKSSQKQLDKTELIDEDEDVKQAIALSLKDFGEASDLQHAGSSQGSKDEATSTNEKRKKKTFKSSVQMTEDDMVINFCQFDEVGKGSIMLRDVQRMAASHDFTWTDKELADMIRCFDSDRDGKLSLDDFRNIVQRCNMLQVPENS